MPLEVSVVKKLRKFGVNDTGELHYTRDEKIFSVDILGIKDFCVLPNFLLSVNFVIECKYKAKNHQWIFMQFPKGDYSILRSDHKNEVFDGLVMPYLVHKGYKLKKPEKEYLGLFGGLLRDLRDENFFDSKQVNKGVDIFEVGQDSNKMPPIIREAVCQAFFGSVTAHIEDIAADMLFCSLNLKNAETEIESVKSKSDVWWPPKIASLTIPIIVTTAKLFTVREDVTLEDIEKEDKISNLLNEEKGVLLVSDDVIVRNFFHEEFKKHDFEKTIRDVLPHFPHDRIIPSIAMHLQRTRTVYIITYENFDEMFGKCINKIEKFCKEFPEKYIEK